MQFMYVILIVSPPPCGVIRWTNTVYKFTDIVFWRKKIIYGADQWLDKKFNYGRDGVSNNQPQHCLLNRIFRRSLKKASKLRATDLCERNSPESGESPAKMVSKAENVSIWWHLHAMETFETPIFRLISTSHSSPPWQNDLHFAFSGAFSWMEHLVHFYKKIHWRLFLRVQLTITQHWFV